MIRQRKPLKRLSEKKAKSGRPYLKRSAIKRKRQSKEDFARKYGSKARVEFVKSLPCAACGVVGYSENAHVAPASEKGTGYKAGFEWIVPLCGVRALFNEYGRVSGRYIGCHVLYDQRHDEFTRRFPDFDPSTEASRIEKMWRELQEQEHLG